MSTRHATGYDVEYVRVWDRFVRVFHWSLAGLVFLGYFTGEDESLLHVYAGYGALGLVAARLVWGVLGSRHARFGDFLRSPATAWRYLQGLANGRAQRHLGHNPAGGWMVVLLLASVLMTCVSGVVVYGLEGGGPLAGWLTSGGASALEPLEEVWEELHELFANLTLVLVFIHVAGVLASSLVHGENLVRAMITGRKRRGS